MRQARRVCIIHNVYPPITDVVQKKQGKSEGFDSCNRPSNLTQIGLKLSIFRPCDLEIWWMTRKIIRHVFHTISSFVYHFRSISESNWSHSPKTPNLGKFDDCFSRVTLQFDVWPWKTIGNLFYATSSFVHVLVAIGEFKLELQSGSAQNWLKIDDFFSRVSLQFDIWPWKTKGNLFYATSSFVHHFVAIGEFKLELQSRNA